MSKEGETRKLSILYATQTGNALDAAERISRESERRGCKAVLFSLDQYDANLLPCEDIVIFVVSTTGQGDTPDSVKFVAKKLDKRLYDLGAMAVIERGLGDDQHPSGYDVVISFWFRDICFTIFSDSILGFLFSSCIFASHISNGKRKQW
ncbi:hypothetical protein MLD38_029075 [Melastoma candidum]|uniref:Uncharacterized protein n=1 Tax=Melastoma candidum TaxID=119954 RepID=A0ACB9N4C1_9MYRT|nr:hypothetical protein MLD38_029075 [Melastoma candidum]